MLKKAFPNMIRFLVGALMLYVGFMFCGWVVLGPYHIKVGLFIGCVLIVLYRKNHYFDGGYGV